MTDDDFLEGLKKMDQADLFGSKSAAWHESVATCILHLHTFSEEASAPRCPYCVSSRFATAVGLSPHLLPSSCSPAGVSIPDGLGLQSIAPDIPVFSARYKLFVRLGVNGRTPLQLRIRYSWRVTHEVVDRVAYARFFFEHRRVSNMPPAARLRLVDERGEGAQGDELYLDLPGEDGALALRDALSPLEARFLHPDYLSAYPERLLTMRLTTRRVDTRSEWVAWLRDSVGVNVVPRVLNGHLTSDFLNRAPELAGQ
jgi:hypothetical protein